MIPSHLHPLSPALTLDQTILKKSDDLDMLEITFDAEMVFEKHLFPVSTVEARRLGIMRKPWPWQVVHD